MLSRVLYDSNRIPYRIDRRLTGLVGPEYDAIISFEPPFESEDSQYGESRLEKCPDEIPPACRYLTPLSRLLIRCYIVIINTTANYLSVQMLWFLYLCPSSPTNATKPARSNPHSA